MPHCDAETLALWALGESPTGSATQELHLAGCARCRSELDQLRAVVGTARSAEIDDTPAPPGRAVWDGIASQLALKDRTLPAGAASPDQPVVVLAEARQRRRGPWLVAAAAAVVGVFAGAVVVGVATRTPEPTLLASAVLDPLNVPDADGLAELTEQGASRNLSVDVRGLPPTDGFYEVWLLDESAEKLVSLGTLGAGDAGVFPIPADLDVALFPVVDVSREPLDGNPAHSTDSVVRGTLDHVSAERGRPPTLAP